MKNLGRRIERLEAEVAPSYERMLSDVEIAVGMVWIQQHGGPLANRLGEILAAMDVKPDKRELPMTKPRLAL
jgi:hypothetical protein